MKPHTPDQNLCNFLEAMHSLSPTPAATFEYRVYYDQHTNECTFKTIDKPEGSYVIVTREEYDNITFCPDYRVTKLGKLIKKQVANVTQKMLELSDSGYRTIKHNNIFVVDDSYTPPTDAWKLRNFDE